MFHFDVEGMSLKAASAFILALVISGAAWAAGNPGQADNELEFGAIQTFSSESEAKGGCGRDPVVWADRYAGYYYYPREGKYGKTSDGAFACLTDAKGANYWSTSPMGGIAAGHGVGREFPDRFPPPMS